MAEKRTTYKSKKPLPAPVEVPETESWDEPAEWMLSERGRKAIALANKMNKTTAGLYSSVPMICRGMQCKYHERCPLVRINMAPYGEACAMEASRVTELFDKYIHELRIDPNDPDSFVDLGFVKELIDIDISLERANKAIAVDGDFIKDVVVAVGNDGRALKKPELHQAIILKEKMQKRKDSILKQLIATREGKMAAKQHSSIDPTQFAANIIEQAMAAGLIPNAILPIDLDKIELPGEEVDNDGI